MEWPYWYQCGVCVCFSSIYEGLSKTYFNNCLTKIILTKFKFGGLVMNRQFAKFSSLPGCRPYPPPPPPPPTHTHTHTINSSKHMDTTNSTVQLPLCHTSTDSMRHSSTLPLCRDTMCHSSTMPYPPTQEKNPKKKSVSVTVRVKGKNKGIKIIV